MLFDVFVLVLASQFMSISDDLWPWEWTWAEPTKEPGPTEGPPGASSDDDVTEVEEVGMRWIIKGPPRWINLYPVKPETIGDRLRQCHGYKCLQAPSGCLALFSYRYSILVLDSLHESLHITYPMILSCPRWWFQQSPSAVVEFQLKPCATRLASTRAEKHFQNISITWSHKDYFLVKAPEITQNLKILDLILWKNTCNLAWSTFLVVAIPRSRLSVRQAKQREYRDSWQRKSRSFQVY